MFDFTDSYDPEAYNPESPAITGAGRAQYRQFIPRIQTQRPNLIGLTSGDTQNSRGITNLTELRFSSKICLSFCVYLPLFYYILFLTELYTHNLIHCVNYTNLTQFVSLAANIVIQTEPSVTNTPSGEVRHGMELDSRKRSLESSDGTPAKKPWTDK